MTPGTQREIRHLEWRELTLDDIMWGRQSRGRKGKGTELTGLSLTSIPKMWEETPGVHEVILGCTVIALHGIQSPRENSMLT